jgi:hypothetical protein
VSAVDAARIMGDRLERIIACCEPVGDSRCMLHPDHRYSCLPPADRGLLLCDPCQGRGNSDELADKWTCRHCKGTGLAK